MTLTYQQLMSWSASGVEAAAEEVNSQIRKKLLNQQDEIDAGRVPGSWHGEAAVRAQQRFAKVRDGLNDLAANVSPIVEAGQTFASEIRSAQRAAQTAHDEIGTKQLNGHHWTVVSASSDGVQTKAPTLRIGEGDDADGTQAEVDKIQGEVDGLASDLAAAIARASQADNDFANVLNSAAKEQYDGGSGTISSAGLPPELRGLSSTDLAKRMLDDPSRYGGYFDDLTAGQKKQIGSVMATETEGLVGNDHFTETQLKKLNAQFAAFGGRPVVATAMLNKLGPAELLRVNGWLARRQLDTDDLGGMYEFSDGLGAQVGAMQRNLGALLGTATAQTADGATGSDSHLSSDWVVGLVRAAGRDYHLGDPDNPSSDLTVNGYQLLGPLLPSASHSGYLLNTVGTGMLDFETNFQRSHDGAMPWVFGADGDQGHGTSMTTPDGTRLDWTHGHGAKTAAGWDPMAGLMDGFAKNGDAARDFFDGPGVEINDADGHGHSESRTDWLMTDRKWDSDVVMSDSTDFRPGHDHHGDSDIAHLGPALKAATMDHPADPHDQKQIGHILDDIVKSSAHDEEVQGKDNLDPGDDQQQTPTSTAKIPPEIRKDIGDIMGYHIETVHDSQGGEQYDADHSGGFGPYGSTFTAQDMRRVLTDIGHDPEAWKAVRDAEYAHAVQAMNGTLHEHPGSVAGVEGHVQCMGSVLGALDHGAEAAGLDTVVAHDDAHNHKVQSIADALHEGAGFLPTDKAGPLGGWALDKGTSKIIDDWEQSQLENHLPSGQYSVHELHAVRETMMEDLVASVMQKNGFSEDTLHDWYSKAGNAYDEGVRGSDDLD